MLLPPLPLCVSQFSKETSINSSHSRLVLQEAQLKVCNLSKQCHNKQSFLSTSPHSTILKMYSCFLKNADPDDYISIPTLPVVLSLSPSQTESCLTLMIQEDEVSEGTEDLLLLLVDLGTTGTILSPDRLTVTITDNDQGSMN